MRSVQTGKSIGTKGRLVVVRGWKRAKWGVALMGTECLFGTMTVAMSHNSVNMPKNTDLST